MKMLLEGHDVTVAKMEHHITIPIVARDVPSFPSNFTFRESSSTFSAHSAARS